MPIRIISEKKSRGTPAPNPYPRQSFDYKGCRMEAIATKDGDRVCYTVYCLTEEGNRRLQKRDIEPAGANPDRPVTKCAYVGKTEKETNQRIQSAAARLYRAITPYLERRRDTTETLGDLFDRYGKEFFDFKAKQTTKGWGSTTIAQYGTYYAGTLRPIYEQFTLPFTASGFLLFQRALRDAAGSDSTDALNKIIGCNEQFLDYLSQTRGVFIGVDYHVKRRQPTREEILKKRFAAVRSFTPQSRLNLLHRLVDALRANNGESAMALGLIIMFCTGARTTEALGYTFRDFEGEPYVYMEYRGKRGGRIKKLKSKNAYRWMPVVTLLADCVHERAAYVRTQTGLGTVDDYPVVCGDAWDEVLEAGRLSAYANRVMTEIGIGEELLQYYGSLMGEIGAAEVRNEDSICAYILRRDFITRLYNYTGLDHEMITYLSAHAQETRTQKDRQYHPSEDLLAQARIALEQYYIVNGFSPEQTYPLPTPHGALPPLCDGTFALSAGSGCRFVGSEPGDALLLTIHGVPGTGVTIQVAPCQETTAARGLACLSPASPAAEPANSAYRP